MDLDSCPSDFCQSFSYSQNSSLIEFSSDPETELLPSENDYNQNYTESYVQNFNLAAELYFESYEMPESNESETSSVEHMQTDSFLQVQKSHSFSEIFFLGKTFSNKIKNGDIRVNEHGITAKEANTLTSALRVKHHISDSLHVDIHRIINEILGHDNFLPATEYLLKKNIYNNNSLITYLYCPNCIILLGNLFDGINYIECETCGDIIHKNNSTQNYFIYCNIAQLFSQILEQEHDNIKEEHRSISENICDVGDGTLHKELIKATNLTDLSTYDYFIDSAPIFKSSENSAWFIKVVLNCLNEHIRFKRVLTVAVSVTSKNFNMQVFLIPFVKWANYLFETGVKYNATDGSEKTRKFLPLCLKADKGAIHKICLISAFNAQFGCPYCLHPNKTVDSRIYNKYILLDEKPIRRSNEMWLNDAQISSSEVRIRGICGKTVLFEIPYIKFPQHLCIEPIHCLYLGITKYVADHLWFKSSRFDYYIGRPLAIKRIDSIFKKIRLPEYSDSRLPKSISNRALWKASQWKYWCLYLSIPILQTTLLHPKYINHWGNFVKGTYLLSKEKIYKDDVAVADKCYFNFTFGMQTLYGSQYMTSNVHSLDHLAEQVTLLGPLWAHSASCDESSIGSSKLDVTGTKGICEQIMNRSLFKENVYNMINEFCETDSVRNLCIDLTRFRGTRNHGFSVYGNAKYGENETVSYPRAIRDNVVYKSECRQIETRNFDCCVRLNDNTFAIILNILCPALSRTVLFEIEFLNVTPIVLDAFSNESIHLDHLTLDHIMRCERSQNFETILGEVIADKCLFFEIDSKLYVANRPNKFDTQ